MGIFSFQIKQILYHIIVDGERILNLNGDKIIGRVMAVSSVKIIIYIE